MEAKPKSACLWLQHEVCACETNLTINVGLNSFPIACIDDEEYGGKLWYPRFKFLGRFLLVNLSESHAQEMLLHMVTGLLSQERRLRGLDYVAHRRCGFGRPM